jgi:hypothetical protein
MAVSNLFDVFGPSGVPKNWNFTQATLKMQAVNYFLFTFAAFQNGRWPLR